MIGARPVPRPTTNQPNGRPPHASRRLENHGIVLARVRRAFADAERFFALPASVKAQYPLKKGSNAGWESLAQVRPSTGTPDQKESYQITLPRMDGLWPSEDELPVFRAAMLDFEHQCWALGMRVLSCFADKLGYELDFFTRAHDPAADDYQSTLRLLHYYAIPPEFKDTLELWRAGAHTDFDCLTLLFQRDGQGGPAPVTTAARPSKRCSVTTASCTVRSSAGNRGGRGSPTQREVDGPP